MSMRDKAKELATSTLEKVEKATGRALGNDEMPVKEQVEEIKVHLKNAGDKLVKSTGKALGDEDMPVKEQVRELRGHVRDAGARVRDSFKKDE